MRTESEIIAARLEHFGTDARGVSSGNRDSESFRLSICMHGSARNASSAAVGRRRPAIVWHNTSGTQLSTRVASSSRARGQRAPTSLGFNCFFCSDEHCFLNFSPRPSPLQSSPPFCRRRRARSVRRGRNVILLGASRRASHTVILL